MAKSPSTTYALGVDYGTGSCRAVIVDTADGHEIASAAFAFPSGEGGVITDPKRPHLARQDPADYLKGFERSVKAALAVAGKVRGFHPSRIVGIGTDATGSTPIPLDASGKPLALRPAFRKNLDAYAWLRKDHAAHEEAAEIAAKARDSRENYLAKCGGTYSSEWFWSKILHCKRSSPKVAGAACTWVEQSDFIPAYLTGNLAPDRIVRSICAAGHKGLYHESWGGWPRKGFLASLAPELSRLAERLPDRVVTADQPAGRLEGKIAKKVGLPAGIPVAAGVIDAHAGAVGAGIKPGTLCKIMGTSTCDMMVVPRDKDLVDIPGVCGIVPGSVVPGMYGIEAGQSAVGDLFNWAATQLAPAGYTAGGDAHARLADEAEQLKPGESGLLALDWNNGNRTVLVDPLLSGLIVGQTLHTTAAEVYRALIEATAFGALTIIRRLGEYGVRVTDVVNCGGIAHKSPLVMQIYADVCNRPMKISRSPETCALGAAVFGAVVGGAYKSVEQAQKQMTGVREKVYRPRKQAAAVYAELYQLYMQLHDAFGTEGFKGELNLLMKKLIQIRQRVA